MSVTILEALQNAQFNLGQSFGGEFVKTIGLEQLNNAVGLLEKGYGLHEEVEPLLEKYGSVDAVPDKEDTQ